MIFILDVPQKKKKKNTASKKKKMLIWLTIFILLIALIAFILSIVNITKNGPTITGGMGIDVETINGNFIVDNVVTMRKFKAGETIVAGSNVSVLNDLAYMGFSDPESTLLQEATVNLIKSTKMSENNFVTVVAKLNDEGFQVGHVIPYTYISGENDTMVLQIGTYVMLPTTGLTAQDRIANAFSIISLDNSRFVIIYSDTSGTGTTAVINRLIVGTFTSGSEFVLPSVNLNDLSQFYSTTDITVTQLGSTVTGLTPSFTSNMVNMFLRYTSGSASGTIVRITAVPTVNSLTVTPSVTVSDASQFQIEYGTDLATQTSTTVTDSLSLFTTGMIGSDFIFDAGVATDITATTANTLTVVASLTVTAFSYFSIVYHTGTASQAGTTLTGVGTTFTSAMVGGTILMTSGAQSGTSHLITAFTSATVLTASTGTLASGTFRLAYRLGPTVSQTTTTATGASVSVAIDFTSAMNRGLLSYQPAATTNPVAITNFLTSSTLTVTPSQSVPIGTGFTLAFLNGTVGQLLTTVTGTGTNFTSDMVGGILTYTSGASLNVQTSIVAFISATQLTVSSSATIVTNTRFSISYGQVRFSPTLSPSGAIVTENNFRIIKQSTDVASVIMRDNTNNQITFFTVIFSGLTATISAPVNADVGCHTTSVIGAVAIQVVDSIHFLGIFNDINGNARYVLGTVVTTLPVLLPSVIWMPSHNFLQALNYTMSYLTDDKLILFFQNVIEFGQGQSVIISVSGPTVTFNSRFTFYPGGSPNVICYSTIVLSPTDVIHFFVDVPNGSFGTSMFAKIDSVNISFGPFQTFSVFNPSPINTMINIDGSIMIIFRDSFDASVQVIRIPSFDVDAQLMNYTLTKGLRAIGIAQNSGTQNSIIEVMVAGYSTAHTNLVINQDYFCHGDGTNNQLAEPQNRTELPARIGLAISSTDLVIRLVS